jgi:hypothetical protein
MELNPQLLLRVGEESADAVLMGLRQKQRAEKEKNTVPKIVTASVVSKFENLRRSKDILTTGAALIPIAGAATLAGSEHAHREHKNPVTGGLTVGRGAWSGGVVGGIVGRSLGASAGRALHKSKIKLEDLSSTLRQHKNTLISIKRTPGHKNTLPNYALKQLAAHNSERLHIPGSGAIVKYVKPEWSGKLHSATRKGQILGMIAGATLGAVGYGVLSAYGNKHDPRMKSNKQKKLAQEVYAAGKCAALQALGL